MNPEYEIFSILTCNDCGHKEKFKMPLYAKRTFFQCSQCKAVLQTKKDECCIYCSYGNFPCPDAQAARKIRLN